MEIILKDFPDNYFDSIVTDPPYGISFMGNHWDYDVPSVDQWKEAFRVLKPGGFILSFGGTRTYHRMVVNIEDAGFEIKDQIQWIYGQGFPKSMDISKSINKTHSTVKEDTEQWDGWGTALKPANEPICMARKPIEGTITATVLKWGTGAINIDGTRIPFKNDVDIKSATWDKGRFPSNVIMDEYCGNLLDQQTGELTSGKPLGIKAGNNNNVFGQYAGGIPVTGYGDTGGASRFFYCPKPDTAEKDKGLNSFDLKEAGIKNDSGRGYSETDPYKKVMRRNTHPTVKPIDLIRYLVKLVTPKGGICLDPYAGSGTIGPACKLELINYVGIDMKEENVLLAEARSAAWNPDKYKPQELF